MWLRSSAPALLLAASLLAGCGGSGTTASSTTSAAGAAAPPGGVRGRVLAAGELSGMRPQPQLVGVDAPSWVVAEAVAPSHRASEVARLRRLGFLAAVREPLVAENGSQAAGVSIVEQFRSASAARAELAVEYGQNAASGGRLTPFAVPGIPGGRGFDLSGQGGSGANVAFTKGPYLYVVGEAAEASSRASVLAAAQHLYNRVSAQ